MSEYKFVNIIVLLFTSVLLVDGYNIPELTVQALSNGEFRVILPDSPGMKAFDVHAKVNIKILTSQDPGSFTSKVTEKTSGYWIVKFSNANVKVGDTINIWVSVTVDSLNFRQRDISVTIAELYTNYPELKQACVPATTKYNGGKSACVGHNIIDEEFRGSDIDHSNWLVEQWIPIYTPPKFIFNSYENKNEIRFVKDDMLYIKPIPLNNNDDVRGPLDLVYGCTSNVAAECSIISKSYRLLPPVKSAKLTSKISFQYGKVSIRAKLPAGDWIFPVIQLEQKNKEDGEDSPKIVIAYSRGNSVLNNNQIDIGSRVLLGGPVTQSEGAKNTLVSLQSKDPYCSQFHIYTLEWLPGRMTLKVDDTVYGVIDVAKTFADEIDIRGSTEGPFNKEFVLSLGVAVGGLVDFPDGYTSGNRRKPWENSDTKYLLSFFDKRWEWITTWKGDDAALRVDYVKVTAL